MKLPTIAPIAGKVERLIQTVLQSLWDELIRAINFNDKFVAEVGLGTQSSTATVAFTDVIAPGFYRLTYYLTTTTTDAGAGTLRVDFGFTDNEGATTIQSAAIALTASARTQGVIAIQIASNGISYTPTLASGVLGTARYDFRAYLERLGD